MEDCGFLSMDLVLRAGYSTTGLGSAAAGVTASLVRSICELGLQVRHVDGIDEPQF